MCPLGGCGYETKDDERAFHVCVVRDAAVYRDADGACGCVRRGSGGKGGGIARRNYGTIDNCYNTGYVEGTGDVANNVAAIAGQNDAASTVDHCDYEQGSVEQDDHSNGDGQDGIGTNAPTGKADVTEKTFDEFQSGEVAWELSQGNGGEGWGQNLEAEDRERDNHPHFMDPKLDKKDEPPGLPGFFYEHNPKKSTRSATLIRARVST